jgi:hypothetical protein
LASGRAAARAWRSVAVPRLRAGRRRDDRRRERHRGHPDKKHKPTKRQVREASKQAQEKAGSLTASPSASGAHGLILGSKDSAQPENMEQFLTAVTKDVDTYWTKTFKDSGLPEPRVSYKWIPAGQTAASACGTRTARWVTAPPRTARVTTRSTSRRSSRPTSTTARSTRRSRQLAGYGRTVGDFAVAYIVAHEYGHQVQDELGLFQKYGQQLPTMAFELQADCYAARGRRAPTRRTVSRTATCRRHSTPRWPSVTSTPTTRPITARPRSVRGVEQRLRGGRPSSCSRYLDPANLGDGGSTPQQDPGAGDPQQQDPGAGDPQEQDPGAGYPQQQDPGAGYPQQQDPVPATRSSRTRAIRRTTPATATGRTASLPAAARRRDQPLVT